MIKQLYFLLVLSFAMNTQLHAANAKMKVKTNEQTEKQLTAEEQTAADKMFAIIAVTNVSNHAQQAEELKQLLQKYPRIINQKDFTGETALMSAIVFRNKDSIKVLIAAGADKNIRSSAGETAFDAAKIHKFVNEYQAAVKAGEEERRKAVRSALDTHMLPDLAKIVTSYNP